MRRAVLIISLVLMLVLGVQSCSVTVGGSATENLSATTEERREGEDLKGAGGAGLIAALFWLIGAGFVMGRPKVSVWMFVAAAVFCVIGASAGFTDLWFWMLVSLAFAGLSWRGISEMRQSDEDARARYRADVQATAEAVLAKEREAPPSASHAESADAER
jgi:hypothetical protein